MPVKVKICGITNESDALAAVEAGADAIGFIFYNKSPRFIAPEKAGEISRILPPFISRVGVFVNPEADFVKQAIALGLIDTLQFHGDEPPEFCLQFNMKCIKAFRVKDTKTLEQCRKYKNFAWLFDTYVEGAQGGTGVVFNWDIAIQARKENRFLILSGGLSPENVVDAVKKVQPYAVDVSSGVEIAPGKKDHQKIKAFISNAKNADTIK